MTDAATADADTGTPGIGSNSIPMGVSIPTMPEYKAFLDFDLAEARERLLDLRVGLDRMPAVVDAGNKGLVTDFIAQCKKAVASAEAGRKKRKEPLLVLSRGHDDYFAALVEPVKAVIGTATKRLEVFHVAEQARIEREKAEAERLARIEREKAEAEAEATRLAAEAASKAADSPEAREAAVRAQAIAADAEAAVGAAVKAEAKAAKPETYRTKSESGAATAYTATRWTFTEANLAAVPVAFLMLNETAVREHIAEASKAGEAPDIPGLVFTKESKLIVKGA